MSFKASDNKLLKTSTEICERVSNLMNIKFDSEPVYDDNDKYIKAKIKAYGDIIDTNFHGNIIPRENTWYKGLSLIMLGSLIRTNKRYYPQTLLGKSKYKKIRNKAENLINDDLDSSSSDESDSEFDNVSDNESDNDESND